MNCQNFENILRELTRQQVMEATAREQALSHAAECQTCDARLHVERILNNGLRDLSDAMKLVTVPKDLEEKLLAEFRSQTESQTIERGDNIRRRYWIYAAAAVLLLIGSVSVVRFTRAKVKQPEVVREVKQDVSNPAVATLSPQPVTTLFSVSGRPAGQQHSSGRSSKMHTRPKATTVTHKQTVAVNNTAREIATEFLPLGFSNVQSLQEGVQEGGQVVRVEMPRYAMSRFGLPVNMDRYDERVKADVLYSADGLARAIRFVQ